MAIVLMQPLYRGFGSSRAVKWLMCGVKLIPALT